MHLLSRNFKTMLLFLLINFTVVVSAENQQSICFGTTSKGLLSHAVRLPKQGKNYKVFSKLAWYLGRTYVHSEVAKVMTETFQQLEKNLPDKKFMYAETGWQNGGKFEPHKTHQNGLSVDFMVPVTHGDGSSAYLPVGLNNKLGYAIEFNDGGKFENYTIDFEAMAKHLKLLDETSKSHDFGIKRVYFDPQLQPLLFNTSEGGYLKKHIKFNDKQAWVRHDEHYHVDFDMNCEKMVNTK